MTPPECIPHALFTPRSERSIVIASICRCRIYVVHIRCTWFAKGVPCFRFSGFRTPRPPRRHASVRYDVRSRQVPLCVDVSQESLQNLVTLILRHEHLMVQRFNTRSNSDALVEAGGQETKSAEGHRVQNSVMQKSELQAGVVLSAVNILTNQVYQLLRGATPFQVQYRINTNQRMFN